MNRSYEKGDLGMFGAGATVRRRAHAPKEDYDGTILVTKEGED